MNTVRFFFASVAASTISFASSPLFAQERESEGQNKQAASIQRKKDRVVEIEREMENAGESRFQAHGEEAFQLFGQIEETYSDMKNAYQQQVIQLNHRMQRSWEHLESAEDTARVEIDKQLAKLQSDWDRTFERLTQTHDSHLKQLRDSLSKLRGEFSEAAGKAQQELEASNFEATARWEETHEILLAVNRTYVAMVGDHLKWLTRQVIEKPTDKQLLGSLTKTRTRYANLQSRFRRRLDNHTRHLELELATRLAQMKAKEPSKRLKIANTVNQLYERKHESCEYFQSSLLGSINAYTKERDELSIELHRLSGKEIEQANERAEQLEDLAAKDRATLRSSYYARVDFIREQVAEFEARYDWMWAEEESELTQKATDLRLLAKSLRSKARELKPLIASTAIRR